MEMRFPSIRAVPLENVRALLAGVVAETDLRSPFAYRLDAAGSAFFFCAHTNP